MNPDPTYINLLFEMLRMLRISSRFGIWASRTSAPILRCVGSWIRQVKAVKAVVAAMILMIYSWWMLMNVDDVWWCWYSLCSSKLRDTAAGVFSSGCLQAFTLTSSLYFWKVVQKNQKRHPSKKHWCMMDVTTWRYVCLSPGVAIWTSLAFRPIFSWAVLSMARLIS